MQCPKCGKQMIFMPGCHWDYDRWYCPYPVDPDARIKRMCDGEIELETTTMPKGMEDD